MALNNRLTLLFITRDFSRNIERSTHYLIEELSKVSNLYCWYEPSDIHHILSMLPERPDFILLNDMKHTHCPVITGLSSLKIPFGIIMHDLHYRVKRRKEFIQENRIRHIFSIYRDAFLERYPEHVMKMRWLPHFANPTIFKDYGLNKDIDMLIMGNIREKSYPFRKKMVDKLSGIPGFIYHKHPGYRDIKEHEKESIFIGENFSREINKAKIFLTCNLIYHYPIRKYYEVLASKTLLLAPSCKELTDLGFQPEKHFIEINERNFLEKTRYYLCHEEEREKIANQGYYFVRENHSLKRRVEQLLSMIEDILSNEYWEGSIR